MDVMEIGGSGHRALLPEGWAPPRGYSHAISATGRILVTGGQIGIRPDGTMEDGFLAQCGRVLENIVCLLREGGARPEHLVRLTWYVTDIEAYTSQLRPLGVIYRRIMGKNFPAMALVQVVRLVEPKALVEIEATAIIP